MRASRIFTRKGSSSGPDLDAEANAQARAHALVQRLQIVRRPVRRHDHFAPGVEQRVQRVTELRLDRLSLEKLRVVEDQQIDRPQALLERDRGLRLQGGDETVHEFLGRQIDDRAALAGCGMRHRLQEMSFAEADGRMDEQRAEGRGAPADVLGDALRGRKGELV